MLKHLEPLRWADGGAWSRPIGAMVVVAAAALLGVACDESPGNTSDGASVADNSALVDAVTSDVAPADEGVETVPSDLGAGDEASVSDTAAELGGPDVGVPETTTPDGAPADAGAETDADSPEVGPETVGDTDSPETVADGGGAEVAVDVPDTEADIASDSGPEVSGPVCADAPEGTAVGQVPPDYPLVTCDGDNVSLRDLVCDAPAAWLFSYAHW